MEDSRIHHLQESFPSYKYRLSDSYDSIKVELFAFKYYWTYSSELIPKSKTMNKKNKEGKDKHENNIVLPRGYQHNMWVTHRWT